MTVDLKVKRNEPSASGTRDRQNPPSLLMISRLMWGHLLGRESQVDGSVQLFFLQNLALLWCTLLGKFGGPKLQPSVHIVERTHAETICCLVPLKMGV